MSELVRTTPHWLVMIFIPDGLSVETVTQRVLTAALRLAASCKWLGVSEPLHCGCRTTPEAVRRTGSSLRSCRPAGAFSSRRCATGREPPEAFKGPQLQVSLGVTGTAPKRLPGILEQQVERA